MAQYAEDAAETDKPWERWEERHEKSALWYTCCYHPKWSLEWEYHRKPRMIRVTHEYPDGTVKTFEYPEPVREPLEDGQIYWSASSTGQCSERVWCGTDANNRHLLRGLIHLTEEAAEAHRRAMVEE
jgi:hypothetical protein